MFTVSLSNAVDVATDAGWLLTAGVALTAAGSAWFHHAPSPATLFWDRLPMALTFSGVALLLLADRFEPRVPLDETIRRVIEFMRSK